ncbi:MAG: AraC family transcriptional regulator [Oscillospiraceae bacterium]|nr:AraC family transcriptional regulator [Oscillospiraceae bacterium]
MHWIESITKAVHFVENNLTQDVGVEDVADEVFASVAHFQRIFHLVTGYTLGDYLRNRRLSEAARDILHEQKLIDVAFKYQYDTQEGFSKAFTRFHGVTPTQLRNDRNGAKYFHPLKINVTIQGGFNMARKLIDHLPIHQLIHNDQGQNYVFNGCMQFLMECLGENEAYDYWFFSAVSGDDFVQVFSTDKTKYLTCFSQAKFDETLLRRCFDAVGYEFSMISAEEWRKDNKTCSEKIKANIDKGIPVIGHGFVYETKEDFGKWLSGKPSCGDISCIVGYEGDTFFALPDTATHLIPFQLNDDLPFVAFAFVEDKKTAPSIAQAYRQVLLAAPQLMKTPLVNGVHFGNDAYEQWAQAVENGFYRVTREEWESITAFGWWYYMTYVCVNSSNIHANRHFILDRALQFNPELADIVRALKREYETLRKLEEKLEKVNGGFSVTYDVLQDAKQCKKIAAVLRQFAEVYTRICEIIASGG